MSVLQESHRAATRDRIIEAVHDVLAEESPASLSIPRVAERAGTSLRTVYRYFPTKEALVEAAAQTFRVQPSGGKVGLDDLADHLGVQWTGFSAALPAIKAQHLTPAGRELRAARLPAARTAVRASLVAEGVDLDDDDQARLADVIVLLTSSSAYLELVDRMGHDEAGAARLAAWATRAVVALARTDGTVAR